MKHTHFRCEEIIAFSWTFLRGLGGGGPRREAASPYLENKTFRNSSINLSGTLRFTKSLKEIPLIIQIKKYMLYMPHSDVLYWNRLAL
jgi:hypothetical protein